MERKNQNRTSGQQQSRPQTSSNNNAPLNAYHAGARSSSTPHRDHSARPNRPAGAGAHQTSSATPTHGPRPQGQGHGGQQKRPQRYNKNKYDGSGSANQRSVRSTHGITTRSQSTNGEVRKSTYMPKRAKLKIIPLGGFGEIGKNMMVVEYDDPLLPDGGDIFIIDMGFAFPEDDMYGIDYVIPDITYLEDKKHKVRGLVITHGHEDHVGGIPFLLPRIDMPIYATKLTGGLIERKLSEHALLRNKKVNVIDPDESLRLGVFRLEFFRVTHSIPDSIGIIVHTPYGAIVHTGDFKIDPTPIDGKITELEKLEKVSSTNGGILMLISDSTNVEEPGYTLSEKVIGESFEKAFNQARGRIIIATFSSLISRIQQMIWAAEKFGRKVVISGRSMMNNIEVATKLGYIKIPEGMVVDVKDMKKVPDDRLVIISTGSQGEPSSALARMASGEHQQIEIKKGDTILLSSKPIPGNERSVTNTIDDLLRLGADVIYDKNMRVHVSGHGCREELVKMIQTCKPRYFLPEHGEYHHMVAHKNLAVANGVREDNTFVIEDGMTIEIDENGAKLSNRRVQTGLVMVDGLGVGDIGNIVLRDRQAMAQDGIFVIIVTVDRRKGDMVSSPDIISRGFVYMRESETLIHGARSEIKRIFSKHQGTAPFNWKAVKEILKEEIGTYLYKSTKRRPMVIPVVIEV